MSLKSSKTFNPDDFLTRAEKIRKIKVPESTQKVVIVRPNSEGIGFRFNCYVSQSLSPEIEKTYFDKTVMQCHKICESIYLQKKNEEEAEYNANSKKILQIGILLVLIALILLVIRVYGPSDDSLLYTALLLILITIAATVLVVIKMYLTSPKFINLEEITKQRLSTVLERENQTFYKSRGFEWRMEPNYYWLELHNIRDAKDTHKDTYTLGIVKQVRLNTENDPLYETLQTE